jgi:hypothetical protein
MDSHTPIRVNDLHDVVDQKITMLLREMETTNWSREEVILAVNDVVKARWLDTIDTSRSNSGDFVSDGNEG